MGTSMFLATAWLAASAGAQTLHVDADLTTGANDGSSWADAFQGPGGLAEALDTAAAGTQVFVAGGTYLPTTNGDRSVSFELRPGVEVYGGFAGGEAGPGDRPPFGQFESVLSGDLQGDDGPGWVNRGDNSLNVVDCPSTAMPLGLLDGFTVRGGNSDAGPGGGGAGVSCFFGSAELRHCLLTDNLSNEDGAAVRVLIGDLVAVDCQFVGNRCTGFRGGAISMEQADVRIERCWFEGNEASNGGAIAHRSTSAVIDSSVFLRNRATNPSGQGGLVVSTGQAFLTLDFRCCTIVGNTAPAIAIGVGTAYRLQAGSPAIDSADASGLAVSTAQDGSGRPRFVDIVGVPNTGAGSPDHGDRGAFEFTVDLGVAYCSPGVNSAGRIASMSLLGSAAISDDDIGFRVTGLPGNAFTMFLCSRSEGLVAGPGGSFGTLCLGGTIGRFNQPGQILASDIAGTLLLRFDPASLPAASAFAQPVPGETWYFQAWHRDAVFDPSGSNFTNAVELEFE